MTDELKLYAKTTDGIPTEYEYDPSWKAMKLMIDGGYPTPEEARAAWEREHN